MSRPEVRAVTVNASSEGATNDLFRTALGADYRLSDAWSVGVQWVHLSHGGVLGDGRNQGIDTAGVRFTRRFGD